MNTENEKLRRVSFLNKTLPLIIIRYGADFEAMLDDIAGAGTSNQILNYNAIEFGLTIDIKDLKPGIYFMRLFSQEKNEVLKFIKAK